MAKLNNLLGRKIGKVTVLRRGPNAEESNRVQWYVICEHCMERTLVVGRDLLRYSSRFKDGCYECIQINRKKPDGKYKYGRNANGFIDKTKVILIKDKRC